MQWPKTGWPYFQFGAFLCQKTTIEYRIRQATLQLMGNQPFDVSGTYDRWLVESQSGSMHQDVYYPSYDEGGNIINNCGELLYSLDQTIGGTYVYAPNPAYPDGSNPIVTNTMYTEGGIGFTSPGADIEETITATSHLQVGRGTCEYHDADGAYYVTTGSFTRSLSSPYTKTDAINHFRSYAAWGAWVASSSPTSINATARYDPNFHFAGGEPAFLYRDAEWRVTRTNVRPSTEHSCTLKVYRRVYGSGDPFTYYADLIETATSDADGTLVVTGETPNESGFESYVIGPPEIAET